ncbi:uncharacterized protein LOC106130143 isoform X2 [Amyelois transitella]|uniref:uncharacterized protein LOC106130143 isoform X2 n=1 Tax=Amyelois transitella TaxID=680683 RepID=UPI00067E29BF|nr:uncharacterized protein LOC106130143 isoform X2 [Amyelois transitella]
MLFGDCGYQFIPTPKGNNLLMFKGYTYSRDHKSLTFYCSKRMAGCKARIKLATNGNIVQADGDHYHERPHYVKTPSGIISKVPIHYIRSGYVDHVERFHIFQGQ